MNILKKITLYLCITLFLLFLFSFFIFPFSIFYNQNYTFLGKTYQDIELGDSLFSVQSRLDSFASFLEPVCQANRHFQLNCDSGEKAIFLMEKSIFDDVSIALKFNSKNVLIDKSFIGD